MQQSTNHSLAFPREALPLPIHHFPIINKEALQQALAHTTAHSSLQTLNDLAGRKARPTVELSGSQTWLPIRHPWDCRLKQMQQREAADDSEALVLKRAPNLCLSKHRLTLALVVYLEKQVRGQQCDRDRREPCKAGGWAGSSICSSYLHAALAVRS